ncbi:MAG: hypothetical protein WC055_00340 [Melioribacteraceae bacterium]
MENKKLSVFDRIILLNILPNIEEVDRTMFGLYHDFLKELSFTQEEHDKFQITHDENGQVKWTNNEEKEFIICNKVQNIIVGRLKACKEKELLQEEHLELYNKFVNED